MKALRPDEGMEKGGLSVSKEILHKFLILLII